MSLLLLFTRQPRYVSASGVVYPSSSVASVVAHTTSGAISHNGVVSPRVAIAVAVDASVAFVGAMSGVYGAVIRRVKIAIQYATDIIMSLVSSSVADSTSCGLADIAAAQSNRVDMEIESMRAVSGEWD